MCGLIYKEKNSNKTLNDSVSSQFLELGSEKKTATERLFLCRFDVKIAIEE